MTTESTEYPPAADRPLLAVLPIGRVAGDIITVTAAGIQGITRIPVQVKEAIPIPDEAYMPAREQYNAMKLLKIINEKHAVDCVRVVGVTAKDIANPILTHVFGEAYMGGRVAVMSYARLKVGLSGEEVPRERLMERAIKVAIHELGHTFNLPHCHIGRCVMRASNNIQELDAKLNYLCDYCEMFLAEALLKLMPRRSDDSAVRESR